jgi:hypothetical protein
MFIFYLISFHYIRSDYVSIELIRFDLPDFRLGLTTCVLWGGVMAVARPPVQSYLGTISVRMPCDHQCYIGTAHYFFPAALVRSSTNAWPAVQFTGSISNILFLNSQLIHHLSGVECMAPNFMTASRCQSSQVSWINVFHGPGHFLL